MGGRGSRSAISKSKKITEGGKLAQRKVETKESVAKQIAKKLGFSEANYKQFLRPSYIDGYSKEQGKEYSLKELKRQLKNIK